MELLYGIADAFSQQPSFKYDGKHQFITNLGFVLTSILYTLTIILGFIIGKELWEKKSPTITSYQKYNPNPGKISLINEFFFMVSLQNVNLSPYIDESIYYSVFNFYYFNETTNQFRIEYINLTRCSNVINKKSKYYHFVKNLDLYNFYCVDKNNSLKDLYINEYWGNKDFIMASLNINPCYLKINSSDCKDKAFINNYLKDKVLSYYFIDNFFNGENYTTPIIPHLIRKFFYPSSIKSTKVILYFKNLKVLNAKDFFHRESKIDSFNVDEFMIMDSVNNTDTIFSLAYQNKNKIQIYKREYYSITKWISEITGYYYFFHIVFTILARSYSTSEFYLNLISDLYAPAPINKIYNNQMQKIIKFDNKINNCNIFNSARKSQVSAAPDNSKSNISVESNKFMNNCINNENKVNENIKNNICSLMHIKLIPFTDKNLYIKHFSENKVIKLFNKSINICNENNYNYNFFEKYICLYMTKCCNSKKAKIFRLRKKFINEILEIKKYVRRSCYFEKIFEEYLDEAPSIMKSKNFKN